MGIWNMMGKRRKPRINRIDSLIGRQSRVSGDLVFEGGLHVDGTIRGNVHAEGEQAMLTLSEKGSVEGEVRVPYIVLNGVVKGDVYSTGHIELAAKARVEGDVRYRLIEMAMGAEVNGKLIRLPEEPGHGSATRSVVAHSKSTLDGTNPKGQTGA